MDTTPRAGPSRRTERNLPAPGPSPHSRRNSADHTSDPHSGTSTSTFITTPTPTPASRSDYVSHAPEPCYQTIWRCTSPSIMASENNNSEQPNTKHTSNSTARRYRQKIEDDPKYMPRESNAFILFRNAYANEHRKGGAVEANKLETNAVFGGPSGTEETIGQANPIANAKKGKSTLSKQAGDAWKAMSQEEKKPWRELAQAEKEEHTRKYPGYVYRPKHSKRKGKDGKDVKEKEGNTCPAKQTRVKASTPSAQSVSTHTPAAMASSSRGGSELAHTRPSTFQFSDGSRVWTPPQEAQTLYMPENAVSHTYDPYSPQATHAFMPGGVELEGNNEHTDGPLDESFTSTMMDEGLYSDSHVLPPFSARINPSLMLTPDSDPLATKEYSISPSGTNLTLTTLPTPQTPMMPLDGDGITREPFIVNDGSTYMLHGPPTSSNELMPITYPYPTCPSTPFVESNGGTSSYNVGHPYGVNDESAIDYRNEYGSNLPPIYATTPSADAISETFLNEILDIGQEIERSGDTSSLPKSALSISELERLEF